MSRQTYQQHKTALFSLVMQLLIPGVLIIVPLGVCMFVVVTGEVGLQGKLFLAFFKLKIGKFNDFKRKNEPNEAKNIYF